MFKYILYTLKNELVWGFCNIKERGNDNETGLKEGEEIEN